MLKDKIYSSFDNLLQREITLKCNNKIIKKGTLKLVDFKDFFIHLTIEINGILKTHELYYPFDVQIENDALILEYKLKALTNGRRNIKSFEFLTSSSKLFNNSIEILYQS